MLRFGLLIFVHRVVIVIVLKLKHLFNQKNIFVMCGAGERSRYSRYGGIDISISTSLLYIPRTL